MLNPVSATVAILVNVWVSEDQGGYIYTSSASLRGFVSDPKLCEIRDFWQSVASNHSVIAPGGSFHQAH